MLQSVAALRTRQRTASQARAMASTAVLVGAHGGALTNALLLPRASALVEIIPARAVTPLYARACSNAGHAYARYVA
ncbi:MAG: hypothetical protein VX017_05035, partial [Pseudomonadota bacterium]|nr:hypothetical protein [Pseudomonadota bacterium]